MLVFSLPFHTYLIMKPVSRRCELLTRQHRFLVRIHFCWKLSLSRRTLVAKVNLLWMKMKMFKCLHDVCSFDGWFLIGIRYGNKAFTVLVVGYAPWPRNPNPTFFMVIIVNWLDCCYSLLSISEAWSYLTEKYRWINPIWQYVFILPVTLKFKSTFCVHNAL